MRRTEDLQFRAPAVLQALGCCLPYASVYFVALCLFDLGFLSYRFFVSFYCMKEGEKESNLKSAWLYHNPFFIAPSCQDSGYTCMCVQRDFQASGAGT